MKVYVNRRPVQGPWGGGNMWVKSAYELFPNLGLELVEINELPDVIYLAGISGDENCISAHQAMTYKKWAKSKGKNVKLILRVNENDARKNTKGVDEAIQAVASEVDNVVFVSKWLFEYFKASSWSTKTCYIYNGVDKDIFKPNKKLDNGLINIVTHHWSDNLLKGFDVYEIVDNWLQSNPEFSFTYIGRDRGTFKNTKVIKPLFGKDLGAELGKYDVYVSASRFDPGPNHIIESLACDIPTYVYSEGGGCVEFAGLDHSFENVEKLLQILKDKNYKQNSAWTPPTWEECIQEFASLARDKKI